MISGENKRKHLEMTQTIINRLAGNLFFLKGWAITLMIGLFGFALNSASRKFILAAFLPVFVFWMLDGYFLSQESLFRDLYEKVAKQDEADIDFSMDVKAFTVYKKNTWIFSAFSRSLLGFYLPLLIIMAVATFLTK